MLSETTYQLLFCFICIFIVFIILHFYIVYCNKQTIPNDDKLEKNNEQHDNNNAKKNIIYSLIESINYKQQQFFNNQVV
jgi:cytochrome bd-type quinol oxidase subunit 1